MKRIISGVLALGVCLTPLTVPVMVRPSWGQSENLHSQRASSSQMLNERELQHLEEEIQNMEVKLQSLRQTQLQNANPQIELIIERLQQYLDVLRQLKEVLKIYRQLEQQLSQGNITETISLIEQSLSLSNKLNLTSQDLKLTEYENFPYPLSQAFRELDVQLVQSSASIQANMLNIVGSIYVVIGQPHRALEYFNQALSLQTQIKDIYSESMTYSNIGFAYNSIGKYTEALQSYEQALTISRGTNDLSSEATARLGIGTVYNAFGKYREALHSYQQALIINRKIGDRASEAGSLNAIGVVYYQTGKFQEALINFEQSRNLFEDIGLHWINIETLNNIGIVYIEINHPDKAITNLSKSLEIALQTRGSLLRRDRKDFLQVNKGTAIVLISLLIDQNQPDWAFQYANRVTTADLADYTRLINAKVSNPQAQQLIDQWNQKNEQIQFLYRQFQSNPSDQLSQQINAFQEENNKLAEDISRKFPEVAELFETTLTDIEKLRSSIPAGTVVIQPVLLTNVKNVPNTVAIFILTKDQLSVIKKTIDPTEFDKLLTEHDIELHGGCDERGICDRNSDYTVTGGKLYDILIRPVEDKIKAFSPKQLSIIATGKLRYIPFETLYDEQTEQFLIQKYPINYLTRLSSRSLNGKTVNRNSLQKGILALGNPIPRDPQNLPGTEEEVRNIAQLFPGSESFFHDNATLDKFKTFAPRFPFLHLATHGCFQPEGCQKLGMEANTLLFADTQLNIADAALLGLQNTELLTLSACQTALQANSNGEEIAGLAYIFERAGAKAVMASLWNAEDNATKDIMIQFYQNIKNGMSKGEALQKAKISLINGKFHPFYWSPFILIGDAR